MERRSNDVNMFSAVWFVYWKQWNPDYTKKWENRRDKYHGFLELNKPMRKKRHRKITDTLK